MDYGIVRNGDFTANDRFGFLISAMDHGAILNIGIIANRNGMNVPPHHSVEPNRAIVTHGYIPYHHGVIGKKAILSKLGRKAPDRFNDGHNAEIKIKNS